MPAASPDHGGMKTTRSRVPRLPNLAVWALCLAVLSSSALLAQTLSLVPDHPDGVYRSGETVRFTLSGQDLPAEQAVEVTVKAGGLTMLQQTTVQAGSAECVEPGTLLAEARATVAGKTLRALAGAVADPEGIKPSAPCPEDFDTFWRAKLAELAAVDPAPQLEPGAADRDGVDYWKIDLRNIRGSRIRGQLARPAGDGKRPAMLVVQWAGVYPLQKGWVTGPASEGFLTLNIQAHDLPVDEPESFYQAQAEGPLNDYAHQGNDDRETSYFLRMYLSCYRAAQYLTERPDWDGKTLVVTGGSQGGLQAIMVAGLHPAITAVLASVPAGCDHSGGAVGRAPGWPNWNAVTHQRDPEAVRTSAGYYDVVHFAARVRCPALVGIGLVDVTCPPAGVLAACNQMRGPCEIVLLPRGGHQNQGGSHNPYYQRDYAWKQALLQGQALPPQ